MYSPEKGDEHVRPQRLERPLLEAGAPRDLLLQVRPPARWLAVAVHRAAVSLRNARRSWRVGGNAPRTAGNELLLVTNGETRSRWGRASLRLRTAGQHLPRGGVNTFEHLYGCGVNR